MEFRSSWKVYNLVVPQLFILGQKLYMNTFWNLFPLTKLSHFPQTGRGQTFQILKEILCKMIKDFALFKMHVTNVAHRWFTDGFFLVITHELVPSLKFCMEGFLMQKSNYKHMSILWQKILYLGKIISDPKKICFTWSKN